MWSRLREIYPHTNKDANYQSQVWDAFVIHLSAKKLRELDEKILSRDYADPHLKVLLEDYRGYIHLNKLRSHVEAILEVYKNPMVRKYCEEQGLTVSMLEDHDISKTRVVEIVSDTYMFVHSLCEFTDPWFQHGVDQHYKRNGHHPQHWEGDMAKSYLVESIMDMAGCLYQRNLGSDKTAPLSAVFDIPPQLLVRYTEGDRMRVEIHLSVLRAMRCTVGGVCGSFADKCKWCKWKV